MSLKHPQYTPGVIIRPHLLTGALRFVQAVSQIDGVLRIALLGSISTTKEFPKDIDLLVTVRDDAELAPLAIAGRRLKGHAQQQNSGADIFLSSPEGRYIGRICQWKNCQSGVRISCDAQHCGLRQYLHDDLRTITLSEAIIANPPVELWPQIVARIALPKDVEEMLLVPLRAMM